MVHQQIIKDKNKKKIYMLVSDNAGISRAGLASKAKLSKSTVSLLVDELINENMLWDTGAVESGLQGRRPNGLEVNKDRFILAVNVRKKNFEISLVTLSYEIVKSDVYQYTHKLSAKDLSDALGKYLEENGNRILGICIVLPAIIDDQNKNIITMVLEMEDGENFISLLRSYIPKNYGVAFFNDTATLAYAEDTFGEIGSENYAYININEGVGASFIQNGKILRGSTGMAMQFGHLSINKEGKLCSCGNRGCLENYIGELALKYRALEYGVIDENSGTELLFKDVEYMLSKGNEKAGILIDKLADDLSYALGKLISILNPELIVIGGIGKKLGKRYLDRIKNNIADVGFRQFCKNIDIRFTKLNDTAIFLGAAKYYMDKHYDFSKYIEGGLFLK